MGRFSESSLSKVVKEEKLKGIVGPIFNINVSFNLRMVHYTYVLLQGKRLDLSGEKSEGLLASDNLLAIQKVRVDQGGTYACSASNSLATNISNQILIDVKCKTFSVSDGKLKSH